MFDLIIIGSGPAGEAAAVAASKQGMSVAIVDSRKAVGGNCTHNGTIPSKALRHIVSMALDYNSSPIFNPNNRPISLSVKDSLAHAKSVISKQVKKRTSALQRNNIQIFYGDATFLDQHTIKVSCDEAFTLKADNFVIATGSRPYRPKLVNFEANNVFDSTTILGMTEKPCSLAIYGAGVIGCEYASIFRGLGVKVTLINTRDNLLSFLDKELSAALTYHFSNQGINLKNNEILKSIDYFPQNLNLVFESGKTIKTDALLYANGRSGNTETLNLEPLGVLIDSRGNITVNDQYQTAVDNIYAVGDVIGAPSLASAAFDQGRMVGSQISLKTSGSLVKTIPTGIYTIPEMSSHGETEEELTLKKIPFEVGKAQFKSLARAQISESEVGFLKILFHSETRELLGVHCFGKGSTEIIHIGQAVMESKHNTIDYFTKTTFNYPTMAEAYRTAAFNGINKLSL